MRKQPEVEDGIKSVIRDELALHPLISIQKIRVQLYIAGYQGVNGGTLDWHYIARLVSRVRRENIETMRIQTREARLVAVKERHRLLTDELVDIVKGKQVTRFGEVRFPTQSERIAAANTIMKWDTTLFFIEEVASPKNKEAQVTPKEKPELMTISTLTESKTKKWARILPKLISE